MLNPRLYTKFANQVSITVSLLILSISQVFGQMNPECSVAPAWIPDWPSWACSESDYVLVFEENFNYSVLDKSKWQLQPWGYGSVAGDGSQQHYLLDNLEIGNGTAKIIAKQQTLTLPIMPWLDDNEIVEGEPNLRTFNYTSCNIWSKHTFFYGSYEIKCRVPQGQGFWSAFWTFGGGDLIDWNEIDVFEVYGHDIERFTCNLHHNWLGNDQSSCGYGQDVLDFSEWNVFRCDFEFDRVDWYINDFLVRSVPRFQTITLQPLVCSSPLPSGSFVTNKAYPTGRMNIIFNLAVQSGSNSPNSSTIFPGVFEIDYIRFYTKKNCCSDLILSTTEELSLIDDPTAYNFICGENVEIEGETQLDEDLALHIKAGNSVRLKPDLHLQSGSLFHAEIDPNICAIRSKKITDLSTDFSGVREPIDTKSNVSLTLQPNPASETVNILIHGNQEETIQLTVVNLYGQIVRDNNLKGNDAYSMNVVDMNPGTYIVILRNSEGTVFLREKLVKI